MYETALNYEPIGKALVSQKLRPRTGLDKLMRQFALPFGRQGRRQRLDAIGGQSFLSRPGQNLFAPLDALLEPARSIALPGKLRRQPRQICGPQEFPLVGQIRE